MEVDPAILEINSPSSSYRSSSSVALDLKSGTVQSANAPHQPARSLLRSPGQTKEQISDGQDESPNAFDDILLPSGFWASDIHIDPANFDVADNLEEEYIAGLEAYAQRGRDESNQKKLEESRRLNELGPGDNYINVPYSPYQWMREVKTEYYFRYEGSQMVPPCFETVHYRIMKDPIRIHPDQLAELERLLAWRIAPKGSTIDECKRDTAGKERPGGNAVDLNRPVQSYSNIHRKVFCECGDWDSKFKEDRAWCELDQQTRFNERPYNFNSGGGY